MYLETISQTLYRFNLKTESSWDKGFGFLAHFESNYGTIRQVTYHPVTLVICVPTSSGTQLTVIADRPVPLVNPRLTWIEERGKALDDALKDRLIGYSAILESQDRAVVWRPGTLLKPKMMEWFNHVEGLLGWQNESLTKPYEVTIHTERKDPQIEWGPFDLDPSESPIEWPFPGKVTDTNIRLVPHGPDGFKVTDGVFSIALEAFEAEQFALAVKKHGWHQAFAQAYPGHEVALNYMRGPS